MYVVEPVPAVPRMWRCAWDDWAAGARSRRDPHGPTKTDATSAAMAALGIEPELCYELHVPMVVDRDALRSLVTAATTWRPEVLTQVQKRSLYGNWVRYGGERADDVKFYRRTPVEQLGAFASSSDLALTSEIGQRIRDLFPERGAYERERTPATPRAGHLAGRRP
jgi:hypothetical protein